MGGADQGWVAKSETHSEIIANENGPHFRLVDNQKMKALKSDKKTPETVGDDEVLKGLIRATKNDRGNLKAEELSVRILQTYFLDLPNM